MEKTMWEYLFGYAPHDKPLKVSFVDRTTPNNQLYRDIDLNTLGVYGWELVSVHVTQSESGEPRYEYWLKRVRAKDDGDTATLGE